MLSVGVHQYRRVTHFFSFPSIHGVQCDGQHSRNREHCRWSAFFVAVPIGFLRLE